MSDNTKGLGLAGGIAKAFVNSKLTPLLIIVSVLLGIGAAIILPREEEPQIKVPMVDVMVAMPGASAAEVERRVTSPMERLLWEIEGVEYVYSTSQSGRATAIVRFNVGEDVERSLVKLHQKLIGNADKIPPGASQPLIKARSIDDVPILAMTFHSQRYDHQELRRVAAEVEARVKRTTDVSETKLIGGLRRQIRVHLDPIALAARNLSLNESWGAALAANHQSRVGTFTAHDQEIIVEAGGFFSDAADVGATVIGVYGNVPVHLSEVARIEDAAEDTTQYVFFGQGGANGGGAEVPAVTLSVAKRPGTNAIVVANAVLAEVERLKGTAIPADIDVTITRNYGETSSEKSNELLLHMAIAIVSVSLLVLFMLGWRESLVVAIAIPSTLALTLLVFYLVGYTLNRITLFALIFSIGILVDDAIVVVENMVRHRDLPENQNRSLRDIAIAAVAEVGNPTILATLAVIGAIVPMAFVGGLMGPYMRPIPVGASAAMAFSLLIAFVVTPWAAARLLGGGRPHTNPHGHGQESRLTRGYRWLMMRLVSRAGWRWSFFAVIGTLLVAAIALVPFGIVHVKMLPFDNKSELDIVINMPEDTSLERTAAVAREIAAAVRDQPEVLNYQVYAGTSSPFTFNGLVRHYDMRRGAAVADIQINLLPKHDRSAQSHDIARRIRPLVVKIAEKYGARTAVVEVPPGPPVLQTLVAEIYGPTTEVRQRLATHMRDIFKSTPGVVDVDWYLESPQTKVRFAIDKEKAALHGISPEDIAATLRIATDGAPAGLLHLPLEREDVMVMFDVPDFQVSSTVDLSALRVRAPHGPQAGAPIPLGELVTPITVVEDRSIYHKNLLPVVYVTGDVAGGAESSVYAISAMNKKIGTFDGADVEIFNASMPKDDARPSIKWDGEWQITLEVFRDLGLAFGVVMVVIYALLVGWFKSFTTPLVVMAAIPFSLVGILPAHAGMGAFFTATSMIGFMAGAGIVVRNSIILVDFIELRLAEGMPLNEAVVDAGAVRFRPMVLTAMAVVAGSAVILFDPIFQGLAISLLAGEVASLLISRMAVPVLYSMRGGWIARHRKVGNLADATTPVTSPEPAPANDAAPQP
ncbi:MAG TPA: efflux RND transporter permease subunit [Kofleriaceae bacterium]|nr:efflux RND transporter permease subunit [Kofleriaceae bacterium]